jgi:Glutaminyl-tRNA synthetase, non-specific RNA binding region part 1
MANFLNNLGLFSFQVKQILNTKPLYDKLNGWISSYEGHCSNTAANLLIILANKYSKKGSVGSQDEIAKLVLYQVITTSERLYAAMKLAKKTGPTIILNQMEICEYCHVGEDYSPEELNLAVQQFLTTKGDSIKWDNLSIFFNQLRRKLVYADRDELFIELYTQMETQLGPKYLVSQ